jgi:hypothetical protein
VSALVRIRDGATGLRRPTRFTAPNPRELDTKITEAKYKANRGVAVASSKLTLSELLEQWIEHTERRLAASTIYTRCGIFRARIEPQLGTIRLDRLTPIAIEQCLTNEYKLGYKPSTIEQTYRLLRMMLNDAVRWGYIGTNVAAKVRAERPSRRANDMGRGQKYAPSSTSSRTISSTG